MNTAFEDKLYSSVSGEIIARNVALAGFTTLRVGGPADYFVQPRTEREVSSALSAARSMNMPVLIVGNGSNLLVRDGGFRGMVLHLGKAFADITVNDTIITAQAGAQLPALARAALENRLTGLEFASGIPGTAGGAACMNAGAYGGEMSQVISSVTAITQTGECLTLSGDALEYGYRTSRMLKEGMLVLSITCALSSGSGDAIAAHMAELNAARRAKQPLAYPSAGSFFKRPEGHFAGALIEQAGLKGASVGGAQVSTLHAGFLINTGGATAQDFLELAALIQRKVYEKFSVRLMPEVRVVGD